MDIRESEWKGYRRLDFAVGGRESLLVCPKTPDARGRWVWRAEFFGAFDAADRLILLDVYAARETDTQGVSSAGLAEDIRARGRDAQYAPSPADAAAAVQAFLCPGDVAVIMGAGDVTRVSDLLCPRTK